MIQEGPGYGTLLDWQTRLSINDLWDADDALDAMAEARETLSKRK